MAILLTATDINPLSRMMKITATAGEPSVVLAQRTQATGVVTSSYLSAAQIATLQSRMSDVAAMVSNADLSLLNYMLQSFVMLTDLTGVTSPLAALSGGVESLSLQGLVNLQPAYVVATLPHSITGSFVWAPM